MYPEDRVLVAYVPEPADFARIRDEGWYRIPQKYAPKGLFAEYFAFYFGRRFGPKKWAIHYYAAQLGHELYRRRDLFPDQPDHPRANAFYYKVMLGPLQELPQPILSLRWRRLAFVHTTWDRFLDAREINDLFVEGGPYVDRLYATLKDRGIQGERQYQIKESGASYHVPLVVPCRQGLVAVRDSQLPDSDGAVEKLAESIAREVAARGGVRPAATDTT